MRAARLFLCPRCDRAAVLTRKFASATPVWPAGENVEVESHAENEDDGERWKSAGKGELSVTERLWLGEQTRCNKTFADGQVHVTALNYATDERSIVRLSLPAGKLKKVPKIVKLSTLPEDSVAGLKNSIADCKQPPKVLQHDADQLTKRLANRRFPASPSEIREARKVVMEEIVENDMEVLKELKNPKSAAFIESMIYKKAQKFLSNFRYNWKPLEMESREQVATFALSQLPRYYAEMQRVLTEFNRVRFVPDTILDYGSGIGGAFWAAHAKWGEYVRQYCLVDENYHMRNFSMDIMRGNNYAGSGEFVNKNVYFRKNLVPSAQNKYDLVILHRTLIEMPSYEARIDLINELWKRTNKYLIIVESPLKESFEALMQVRDYILTAGTQFDFEVAKRALDERARLDMKTIHFLADKRISDYEKLCVVREMLGDDFHVPTKVEQGYVHAPCPHDQGCPKLAKWLDTTSTCDFHVRWAERRADHKTESWMKDGTLTGSFCYVIMAKGERPKAPLSQDGVTRLEHPPRILRRSEGHGCSTCTICTPNDGLQSFTVSKRAKDIFKRVIAANEGQLFPVDYKIVKSSSQTSDFIRGLIEGNTDPSNE